MTILSVENLTVKFGKTVTAVGGVSFDLRENETLCIIGESGSGKSTTAFGIQGLLPDTATVSGKIEFDGQNIVDLSEQDLEALRGNQISMIFQEPMTSLNPVLRIGDQIAEPLIVHQGMSQKEALQEAKELLELVKIPDVDNRIKQYPHQLSGGMRQRVMIAMALACRPDILIADEPTTALDVTIQAEVLDLLNEIRKKRGLSIIFITHDLGVVAQIADRVAVMLKGEIVEFGEVRDIFNAPQHDYTKKLLGAALRPDQTSREKNARVGADADMVLKVDNLTKSFFSSSIIPFSKGTRVDAVRGVSLEVRKGETVGIVGESGCGKTTLTRSILGLITPTSGRVEFQGRNIEDMSRAEVRKLRQKFQIVFQDPYSSLNPKQKIGAILAEPLKVHRGLSYEEARPELLQILEEVSLPAESLDRFPHEFSGGQRQRIAIARALVLRPELIIADEAVSALDTTVRAQILDLLREIQKNHGISLLFITHDLAVMRDFCDRAVVMHKGKIVEEGIAEQLLDAPQDPYTKRLRDAAPVPEVA